MRRSLDVLRRARRAKDRGLPSDDNPRRRLPLRGLSLAAVVMLAAPALADAPDCWPGTGRPCHQSHRPDAEGSGARHCHHQADQRFLQARAVRTDAGRRRYVEEGRQQGLLLAILGQHHFRGRGHLQARQCHFPQELGVGAVLDAGIGWARSAVQRAGLPELPSEGRPRPSAGRRQRHHLDVPAAGPRRRALRKRRPSLPTTRCSISPTRSTARNCRNWPFPACRAKAGCMSTIRNRR